MTRFQHIVTYSARRLSKPVCVQAEFPCPTTHRQSTRMDPQSTGAAGLLQVEIITLPLSTKMTHASSECLKLHFQALSGRMARFGEGLLAFLLLLFHLCSSRNAGTKDSLPEMTVMTANAPKVPINTVLRDCCKARRTAMKKVLSPISDSKIRRNACTKPSLSGLSPTSPANNNCLCCNTKKNVRLQRWCSGTSY